MDSEHYELPPEIARILATDYTVEDLELPGELQMPSAPDFLEPDDESEPVNTVDLDVTRRRAHMAGATTDQAAPVSQANVSSIEDYIRNFLARAGLARTLECFQSEWLEANARGNLPATSQFVDSLPDAIVENQQLHRKISELEQRNAQLRSSADRAREQYEVLRKDRDFHKVKHRRAYQERTILINDLRRLRDHCALYEPLIRDLTERYDAVHRAKQMVALQRDKLESRVAALEETIAAVRGDSNYNVDELIRLFTKVQSGLKYGQILGPNGERLEVGALLKTQPASRTRGLYQNLTNPGHFTKLTGTASKMDGTETKAIKTKAFPSAQQLARLNPLVQHDLSLKDFETVADPSLQLNTVLSISAHESNVTSVDIHLTRQVYATAGADGLWKIFASYDSDSSPGQLVLSGSGHRDFITSARFCPLAQGQTLLSTTSADAICKLWNIATQQQVLELAEHSGLIWDCSWHCMGNVIATCSQDMTVKIWDVTTTLGRLVDERGTLDAVGLPSLREGQQGTSGSMAADGQDRKTYTKPGLGYCIGSLRGHTGPVLSVAFEPFGNLVLTSSTDKTVRVWDPRTLTCVGQYTFNVTNAVKASWSLDAGCIVAGDADGHLAVYDRRATQHLLQMSLGAQAGIADVCFDRSAEGVVAACADCSLRLINVRRKKVVSTLRTSGAVEALQFSRNAATCLTGSETGEVNVWTM
ncbi:WD40 repeat protein [Giardia muris]|uniref:WD40 repeat protein n=1 Tax=Giardia muris TaxID=5742 RepID=A0A4Z1SZR4_GIAMU|nr:WD40 repeat protein [Giardia muris]|eukprot:TNJ27143.1 WD40 repeat protein [Giardia muris]